MPSPLALAQLARMLGREEVALALALDSGPDLPAALTEEQQRRVRLLAADHVERIASALIEEIDANDDIQNAGSARAYLDDRLTDLSTLLADETATAIRIRVNATLASWT